MRQGFMKISVMGISLLLGTQAWAFAPGEITALRKSINANKQSIETFLETKGHPIAASNIASLDSVKSLNILQGLSEESALGSTIIDFLNKSILPDGNQTNFFIGADAISNALTQYTIADLQDAVIENAPSVYSLTVLNPEHQEFLNKSQADYNAIAETTSGDPLLGLMSNYIDNSISAKKFATYEEALELVEKINQLRTDLQELEAKAPQMSLKAQERLENFTAKMDQWLNKKIIFLRLNPSGVVAEVIQDRELIVDLDTKNSVKLSRNYSTTSIGNRIRKYYRDRALEASDETITITAKDDKGRKRKYSFKAQDRIEINVSIDRSSALVQIPSGSFRVSLSYINGSKLTVSVKDKQVYNAHRNTEPAVAIKSIFDAKEVMLKSVHKSLGAEWFSKDLGNNSFSVN